MADRTWRRWLPAIVAPIVVIGGALAVPLAAGAAGVPPERSAQEVLEMVGLSDVPVLSGTVEQTSDLGLPDLSGALGGASGGSGSSGSGSALELLTGSHTARIYFDESVGARVQILDGMAERDLIAGPNGVWLYDYSENTATHVALPSRPEAEQDGNQSDAARSLPTPSALAQHFLDAIDPSTAVAVENTSVVAGRSAYDLVLTPDSATTLIGSVTIAVDAETGLPLGVTVDAKGQSAPAFSIAFTELTLGAPDASLFSFTPPQGATIEEQLPHSFSLAGPEDANLGDLANRATVSGDAWDTIVELPSELLGELLRGLPGGPAGGDLGAQGPADPTNGESAASLLESATEKVDGGRVLSTALLNVLITDDGRVFAGSVPVAQLLAAAAA